MPASICRVTTLRVHIDLVVSGELWFGAGFRIKMFRFNPTYGHNLIEYVSR